MICKNTKDIDGMRAAGKLAAETLEFACSLVEPGVSTKYIDTEVEKFILSKGATSPCKGYKGYPYTICTSVNDVVCHGMPNDKKLTAYDIINIDVVVELNGYCGDTSKTIIVIDRSNKMAQAHNVIRLEKLIDVAKGAMERGISKIKPGATTNDIGIAIQEYAETRGCSVVREFCGHGIGNSMHEAPQVLHYKHKKPIELVEGMCLTVEPMINKGYRNVKIDDDGWTVLTKDGTLSVQFEHTVLVTATGYEILTESD